MTTDTPATARTRLSPAARREQLLDLGVALLATRSLDELTIDVLAEEAGVSRGLLYHYFGGKQEFREAVVRRAIDDLVAQTAPVPSPDPLERLVESMRVYVDYVAANYQGYSSLVRAAAGGNDTLRALYEEARTALTDRIFTEGAAGGADGEGVAGRMVPDTPAARLVVRGWSAMAEELVLTWVAEPGEVTRDQLVDVLAASLPALVELLP